MDDDGGAAGGLAAEVERVDGGCCTSAAAVRVRFEPFAAGMPVSHARVPFVESSPVKATSEVR